MDDPSVFKLSLKNTHLLCFLDAKFLKLFMTYAQKLLSGLLQFFSAKVPMAVKKTLNILGTIIIALNCFYKSDPFVKGEIKEVIGLSRQLRLEI